MKTRGKDREPKKKPLQTLAKTFYITSREWERPTLQTDANGKHYPGGRSVDAQAPPKKGAVGLSLSRSTIKLEFGRSVELAENMIGPGGRAEPLLLAPPISGGRLAYKCMN